ncbi:MAG: nucleotidyl transferase AbiEii/AbiGii toxin family protein [Desulfovermiculus sp.]
MRWTFSEHLQFAVNNAGQRFSPAIVAKEMLHFDLLRALSNSSLGDSLVFQGGTALRICHNGDRLSEDLDFVCGFGNAEPMVIDPMLEILQQQMGERYGLQVDQVKGPKGQELTNCAQVKQWEFLVRLPVQKKMERIRIEVCNVPAHSASPMLIRPTYPQLEQMEPIVLLVESIQEIMADKIVALAARKWLKYRDVWDLKQLTDRGTSPDLTMIRSKVEDYKIPWEQFAQGLDQAQSTLRSSKAQSDFIAEMSRFVSMTMANQLTKYPQLSKEWLTNAIELLEQMKHILPAD